MGVGNYCQDDAETVIVRGEQIYGEDSHDFDDNSYSYDNFIENLCAALPKSWESGRDVRHLVSNDHRDRTYNPHVIAANKLFKLSVASYDSDVFVSLEMQDDFDYKDGFHPLARSSQVKTAEMIWKILEKQGFDLCRRCCAWTSGPVRFGPPREPTAEEKERIARREGLTACTMYVKRYDKVMMSKGMPTVSEYLVQDKTCGSPTRLVRAPQVHMPGGFYIEEGWGGKFLAVPCGASDSPHYGKQHSGYLIVYDVESDRIGFNDGAMFVPCEETESPGE